MKSIFEFLNFSEEFNNNDSLTILELNAPQSPRLELIETIKTLFNFLFSLKDLLPDPPEPLKLCISSESLLE